MKFFDFGAYQKIRKLLSREKYIVHVLFGAFHGTSPVFTKSLTLETIYKHKKSLSSCLCITYYLPTKHGMTIHWHRYQDIQLHCTCVLVTQYQQKLIYFQYCKREVLQNHLCMSQLRLGSHNFDHCFSDSLRHLPHYEEYLHRKHHLSVTGHYLCSNYICSIS